MSNIVALAKQISTPEAVLKVLTLTQLGWLKLEYDKRTKFIELQNFELAVQGRG